MLAWQREDACRFLVFPPHSPRASSSVAASAGTNTSPEAFRIHPAADVALTYELSHDRDALVDPPRAQRVFANIVANALEAMMGRGRLWFRTRSIVEEGQDFVEFTIGNDGPSLPADVQSQVFNAHYTRGKRSGTGLGLAIAQRVVLRHGGRIDCGSPSDGRGVEFRFTFPAGPGRASIKAGAALPSHARGLAPHSAISRKQQSGPAREESLSHCAVATAFAHLPEVAVVDDSRVFLRSWRSCFEGRATSHAFASPEAFFEALGHSPGLLARLSGVITDERFDSSAQTGFSLAREVRRRRPDLPLALSSSAVFSDREWSEVFDGVLDKESPSWTQVTRVLGLRVA